MAEEWIGSLAQEIKQKNREAAEQYGRDQHFAGVVATQGKQFFAALAECLHANVDALRRQLQGDAVSAETTFQTIKVDELKITRARFPWVDAHLVHREDTILLDYAKGLGVAGDPAQERTTRAFAFKAEKDDTLFVEEAFVAPAATYRQPDDLARHIMELLFEP